MGYEITISHRRLEAIFGNRYPKLSLSTDTKRRFLEKFITQKFKNIYMSSPIDNEYSYLFGTRGKSIEGYHTMVALERWIATIPLLGIFSPPRFFHKLFFTSPVDEIFCIDEIPKATVLDWIDTNEIKHTTFQLFSRFDNDISLTFSNPQHTVLFKLEFAEYV